MERDLPFTPEIDEPLFVEPAVRIAASGYLNPGWFGNPGSTIIYPLAVLYRMWHTVAHSGVGSDRDFSLEAAFEASSSEFYPESAFYRWLFAEVHLLQQFEPSATRGGPVIRVYELPETAR